MWSGKKTRLSLNKYLFIWIGFFVFILLVVSLFAAQYIYSNPFTRNSAGSIYAYRLNNIQKNKGSVLGILQKKTDVGFDNLMFGNKKSGAAGFYLSDKNGVEMTLEVDKKDQSGNVMPLTSTGKNGVAIVTYADIQKDVDLVYKTTQNHIKEEIIINTKQAAENTESYIFNLNIEGLSYQKNQDGTVIPTFTSIKDKETTYTIPPAFMIDSKGSKSYGVTTKITEDSTNPNNLIITLIPNKSWLTSPDRQFPIIIDPTLIKGNPPILSLNFDEGNGGTTYDGSTNSHDGTITAAVWAEDALCVSGRCLSYDGTNDYVTFTDHASLDIADSTNLTVSAWVKLNTSASTQTIVSKKTSTAATDAGYILTYNSSSSIFELRVADGTDQFIINSKVITDTSKWIHVMAVFDEASSANSQIYINGQEAKASTTGNIANVNSMENSIDLIIGTQGNGNADLNGFVDSVKVYNYARTSTQVRQDYAAKGGVMGVTAQFGPDINRGLSDGLVGYWKMDETAANTCSGGVNDSCDSSGNGLNGSWTGNSTHTIAGKYGYGTTHDGSGDYINIDDSPTLSFTGPFTVAAWVKRSSTNTADGIFGKYDSDISQRSYMLGMNTNYAQFVVSPNGVSTTQTTGTTAISSGQWYHIAGVYDGSNIRVFVNGVQESSASYSMGVADNATSLHIGDGDNTWWPFHGVIDEARAYNRALSEAEVRSLYSYAPGPVGWWKMDEGTGTTIVDTSGNGATLSTTNSPGFSYGKFGSSLNLVESSNQYASRTDTIALSQTGNLTLSAWIKPSAVTASTLFPITGKSTSSTISYQLAQYGDEIRMYIGSAANYVTTNASNLSVDTWYHVEAVYTASTQTVDVYINGVKAASTTTGTIPTSIADGGDDFAVGYYSSNSGSTTLSPVPEVAASTNDGYQNTNGLSGDVTNTEVRLGNAGNALKSGFRFTAIAVPQGATITSATFKPTSQDTYNCGACTLSVNVGLEDADDAATFSAVDNNISSRAVTTAQTTWNIANLTTNVQYSVDVTSAVQEVVDRVGWVSGNDMAVIATDNGSSYSEWQNMYSWDHASGAPAQLTISYASGTTNYYDGAIDDVKLYNYARTPGQIIEDMNGGHPVGGSPVGSQMGYWKFDDGYGDTAYDWSPQNLDGDLAGSGGSCPGNASCPTWTSSGKLGKALSFDGSDDFVNVGDVIDTSGNTSMSLSAWVNVAALPGTDGKIVSKYNDGVTGEWYLSVNSNGTVGFLRECGSYGTSSTTVLSTSTWYHVVGVYDGTNLKIYINGKLVKTAADSCSTTNTAADVYIGASDSNTSSQRNLNAIIDEVKIYAAALTQEQVQTEYLGGVSTKFGSKSTTSTGNSDDSAAREYCVPGDTTSCDPPLAVYKLDENTSTVANNSVGGAYAGTLTNGPEWTIGKFGKGVNFIGTDDYITTGNIFNPTSAFTISMWAYLRSTNTNNAFFSSSAGETSLFAMYIQNGASNNLAYCNDASACSATATSYNNVLSDNVWQHITFSYDGSGTSRFYVNGVDVTSDSSSGEASDTGNKIFGNFDTNTTNAIAGVLDEIHVYNYVRTPAQVVWDYSKGAPAAWYKFDECSGVVIQDWSPNANGGYNNNDGTLALGASPASGSCTTSGAWFNGAEGKQNASINLDGSDDEITITDTTSSVFDFASGLEMTVSAWINPSGLPGGSNYASIFSKSGTNGNGYYAQIQGNGALEFCIFNTGGGGCYTTTRTPVVTSVWQHLTYSITVGNASTMKIYYNGQLLAGTWTDNGSTVPDADNANINIGSSGSTTEVFSGKIDDLKLYRYTLTNNQIITSMNDGSAVRFK